MLQRPRVLVVDGDETIRAKTISSLKPQCLVSHAEDGLDAFSQVQSRKPDVILLELELSVWDGFQFLEKLPNINYSSGIRTICLTNDATANSVHKAIALGATDYILKQNVEKDLLLSRIARQLNRPEMDPFATEEEKAGALA